MKLKYVVYTLLVVAFCALVGYRLAKNNSDKDKFSGGGRNDKNRSGNGKVETIPPMKVDGIIVQPEVFSNSLSVSGSIEPNEQVEIKGQVSGIVRSINFKEGGYVSKGQLLVQIDDSELRAQLLQALTKLNLAAESERRAALLLKKEAISREEYDTALADLKTLKAQTQLIRAQLAKARVIAPFSGKIGLRSISVGEYLTPTTNVANLLSSNPVKIRLSVPEKYSGQLMVNTILSFTVAGSTEKYTAKVYAIEPGIDVTSRTLQLKALASNPTGKLLPGSFAKIELPLATIRDAILIPTQAVVPVLNGKKVFVTDSGKVKEVMIETSTRTATDVVVTSGLKAGDTVLTTGIMSLKPKASVKVKIAKERKQL